MTKVSVNLNEFATLRNAREGDAPSVVACAALALALDGGAHGLTVHPRPDERHIRAVDVRALAAVVAARDGAEYTIEGNPFDGLLDHVERVRPTQATLVPDTSTQRTSDRGWDLPRDRGRLEPVVCRLREWGMRVSLFVDAVPGVLEVSIGHAVISDALEIGLGAAVARYVAVVNPR